jgi:hypothetical protein
LAVSSLQAATKSCSRPDLTVMREMNVIRDMRTALCWRGDGRW